MLISELARATNESPRTLRFYETAGLLAEPPRTPGNYRDYPHTAIGCVRIIRSLQSVGLTLDQVATVIQILDNARLPRSADVALVQAVVARIETQLGILGRMRNEFEAIVDRLGTASPTVRSGSDAASQTTSQPRRTTPSWPATHFQNSTT